MTQLRKNESWLVWLSAIAFFLGISWMTFRQYAVFHLQAPDVVLFSQAMWNTLQGDFLYSTLTNKTVLAHHFTPIFGLVAPVLWLWEDPRALFLMQTAGLTASGLILWRIAKEIVPKWAFLILVAFFLNAVLHEVAIQELRRIPFATPFIALALYGLVKNKMWPLLIGLFFALLAKEDVGILVFTFGLFAFVFLKRRLVGGGTCFERHRSNRLSYLLCHSIF